MYGRVELLFYSQIYLWIKKENRKESNKSKVDCKALMQRWWCKFRIKLLL